LDIVTSAGRVRGNLALRAVPAPVSGCPDDDTPASGPAGSGRTGAGALGAGETGAAAPRTRRGRLLIIDDEVVFSGSLRRLFSNEHDVTVINHGRAALDQLRAGQRIAPDQAESMIFLTGGVFSEKAQQFLDGIANRWFEKPCNLEQLRAAVRQ